MLVISKYGQSVFLRSTSPITPSTCTAIWHLLSSTMTSCRDLHCLSDCKLSCHEKPCTEAAKTIAARTVLRLKKTQRGNHDKNSAHPFPDRTVVCAQLHSSSHACAWGKKDTLVPESGAGLVHKRNQEQEDGSTVPRVIRWPIMQSGGADEMRSHCSGDVATPSRNQQKEGPSPGPGS